MKRRGFLGGLVAAIIAPFLPRTLRSDRALAETSSASTEPTGPVVASLGSFYLNSASHEIWIKREDGQWHRLEKGDPIGVGGQLRATHRGRHPDLPQSLGSVQIDLA